jgi:hypothetical protein
LSGPQNRRYRGLRYGWKALRRTSMHPTLVRRERAVSIRYENFIFYENLLNKKKFIRK